MVQEQNKSRSLLRNSLPYIAALGTAGAVAAVTYFKYAHAQRHPSSNCSELEHLVASASTLLTPENIAIATTALSFGLGFIKIQPGISAALSPATFKVAATEALRPSAIATGYNLASAVGMSLSQAFQYGALAALANYVAYNAGYVTRCFFDGFGSSDAPKKIVSRKEQTPLNVETQEEGPEGETQTQTDREIDKIEQRIAKRIAKIRRPVDKPTLVEYIGAGIGGIAFTGISLGLIGTAEKRAKVYETLVSLLPQGTNVGSCIEAISIAGALVTNALELDGIYAVGLPLLGPLVVGAYNFCFIPPIQLPSSDIYFNWLESTALVGAAALLGRLIINPIRKKIKGTA